MKQVIVFRKDIKMGKGKIVAQGCHAAIGSYKHTDPKKIEKWEKDGCAKIALKIDTLDELLELRKEALIKKIPNFLVTDAGKTQLPTSTITCLGIGPDEDEIIDSLTNDLKLL